MTAPLFFGINEGFEVSINQQLKDMSVFRLWDKGKKCYVYLFPLEKLHEVVNLTQPLIFDAEDLTKILAHTNQKFDEVEIDQWQGVSGYDVLEFPNFYRVISYQKRSKDTKPRASEHDIPKSRVVRIWQEVMLKQEKGQYNKYTHLAPKVCRIFELRRYFYDEDKMHDFRKELFQGTRMHRDYGKFYYHPMKILEHYHLIHRRGQWIARMKDTWEEQPTLKEGTDETIQDTE